eukprot:CAMPEP_0183365036 /NCGR_PEP_ID=MMETSP0164_2-20130417/83098_1 /TAXON_ID=221442 /ORGANISM="Coccolithus pelagicus ssp braarudi, Strain PLY182g" /LENGTH=66 /DNA_ID=CAMNT_0025540475 /DNA_START=968 /DNA_END=1165 /DNA_ORIENTATION=-
MEQARLSSSSSVGAGWSQELRQTMHCWEKTPSPLFDEQVWDVKKREGVLLGKLRRLKEAAVVAMAA